MDALRVEPPQDAATAAPARRRDENRDAWVRQVFDHSPVAIFSTDAAGWIQHANKAAAVLWGGAPVIGEARWCGASRLYYPDGRPMSLDDCALAKALKTGEATQGLEGILERPDGTRATCLAYPTLLRDATGEVVGAVNMLVDISDRKQAEERQKILIDELNHRVKNTLASVQSLAAQSLRGAAPAHEMRERFEARLVALSKAHNQLADRHWRDANLLTLAENVLAPYRDQSRVVLHGGQVIISARAAVTLSMVLHELATNAVKYGSLSTANGRLTVSWRTEDGERLVLVWREHDGPVVSAPTGQGFGTRFITGSVASELGGRISLDFNPAGLSCRIEAPLCAPISGAGA